MTHLAQGGLGGPVLGDHPVERSGMRLAIDRGLPSRPSGLLRDGTLIGLGTRSPLGGERGEEKDHGALVLCVYWFIGLETSNKLNKTTVIAKSQRKSCVHWYLVLSSGSA